MATINARAISAVRYGTLKGKALYLGTKKIWPSKYLRVAPAMVYLTPWNNYTADANVYSNLVWTARVTRPIMLGDFDDSFDDSFDNFMNP